MSLSGMWQGCRIAHMSNACYIVSHDSYLILHNLRMPTTDRYQKRVPVVSNDAFLFRTT